MEICVAIRSLVQRAVLVELIQEEDKILVVETDEPSVVLYTGNQLSEDFSIRGVQSRKYLGLCLETQGLPDSIHHSHFPSCILEKKDIYQSTTKYHFATF